MPRLAPSDALDQPTAWGSQPRQLRDIVTRQLISSPACRARRGRLGSAALAFVLLSARRT